MSNEPNVYERFIEEVEALTIMGTDSAVHVVGVLTRAVNRAQAVVDGALPTVANRDARQREVLADPFGMARDT